MLLPVVLRPCRAPSWLTAALMLAGVLSSPLSSAQAAPLLELHFSGTPVPPPKGVHVDDEGPCGPVVVLRVSAMPRKAPWFVADEVQELDAAGRVLRSWRVPLDHVPAALDGDVLSLSVWSRKDSMLTVTPDGRLGVRKGVPPGDLPGGRCPGATGQDDRWCVRIGQGADRHVLAYPPICS